MIHLLEKIYYSKTECLTDINLNFLDMLYGINGSNVVIFIKNLHKSIYYILLIHN